MSNKNIQKIKIEVPKVNGRYKDGSIGFKGEYVEPLGCLTYLEIRIPPGPKNLSQIHRVDVEDVSYIEFPALVHDRDQILKNPGYINYKGLARLGILPERSIKRIRFVDNPEKNLFYKRNIDLDKILKLGAYDGNLSIYDVLNYYKEKYPNLYKKIKDLEQQMDDFYLSNPKDRIQLLTEIYKIVLKERNLNCRDTTAISCYLLNIAGYACIGTYVWGKVNNKIRPHNCPIIFNIKGKTLYAYIFDPGLVVEGFGRYRGNFKPASYELSIGNGFFRGYVIVARKLYQ